MNPELVATLKRFNQSHLLRFADQLDPQQVAALERQLSQINFSELAGLYESFGQTQKWAEMAARAQPPAAIRLDDATAQTPTRAAAIQRGQSALAAGEVALIMVAGGQGTRLGFAHPKGLLPVGPVSGRTLFQIHIDKLRAIAARYGTVIPLYIMTSPATDQETNSWLDRHDWFGYPADCRATFCQGTMPAVDAETGHVLLSDLGQVFLGPDGHGGMLKALDQSGCLADINARGIRQIFYCQVDNPMCQICDPATIGYHLLTGSEMSSQAIPKSDALQNVGNLVSIDGQIHVIEYSDLPESAARQTHPDGTLKLWAGSIAVHVMDVDFLNRMTRHANALPFHLAHKKVPFIDAAGQRVEPRSPNAIKFERFIFDLLPMARHSIVVEVDPATAFSPVKNAATHKTSTVRTAQQAMMDQARRALHHVGVEISESVDVEVAPALLADADALQQRTQGLSPITGPVYVE